jgi:O-antigen ligase
VVGILVKFGFIMGFLAILAVILWNILPDDMFLKKGFETFLSGKLDASSMGRIAAWYTAWTIMKTHPIWGAGPGNFLLYNIELLQRYHFIPVVQTLPRLGHAHNLFLMVLSDYGLVGFAALSVVCGTCAVRLIRYIRKAWDGFGFALLCGGIVTLFLGLFDVFPLFPSSLGWGAWYMGVLYSLRTGDESRTGGDK